MRAELPVGLDLLLAGLTLPSESTELVNSLDQRQIFFLLTLVFRHVLCLRQMTCPAVCTRPLSFARRKLIIAQMPSHSYGS